MSEGRDFWRSCGHHLLDRDADGLLLVTDEFLKAHLARPELVPLPEACPAERRLHGALLTDPRQPVAPSQITAIADADARENWELVIAWRDHLVRHGTLEAAYLDIVRRAVKFRSLVAADDEAVSGLGGRPVSPLVSLLGLSTPPEFDVLSDANADSYWERSDPFDMALDLTAGRRGLAALGDVVMRWISHLLAIDVAVEPLTELRDVPLTWYVGLDPDATRIGDALWHGHDVEETTRARVVGLYRLTFADPRDAIEKVSGEPVYLMVAMSAYKALRLKPQNLVTGLPVRQAEIAN